MTYFSIDDSSLLVCKCAEDEFTYCRDIEAYYISNKVERKAEGGGSKTNTIIKTTSGYWREKKKDIAIYNKEDQIIGYKTHYRITPHYLLVNFQ